MKIKGTNVKLSLPEIKLLRLMIIMSTAIEIPSFLLCPSSVFCCEDFSASNHKYSHLTQSIPSMRILSTVTVLVERNFSASKISIVRSDYLHFTHPLSGRIIVSDKQLSPFLYHPPSLECPQGLS